MNDPLEAIRTRLRALRSGTRLGQFVSVGLVGTAVDTLVLVALVELAGVWPVLSKAVAWEVAVGAIFLVNERWTFRDYGDPGAAALARRFLRSNAVRLGGFVVTLAVFTALVYGADVWYLVANAVGIGVGFVVNYTLESLYTWRVHRDGR